MVGSALGDEVGLEVGEGELLGVALGVKDSVSDGSGAIVSVTVGVLRMGSEESLQPKKLESINTVPTAPTTKFVLLSDFKLHGLNGTV